ncbi:MAG: SCP2 sterol-binding domain-containing protein [Planctomycetes bacterium]|nr:SCP2 sterol-binding domain-containing protein [Planctomycetota bacterium]
MATVKEMVDGLPGLFNSARAKGYNRQIQLKISGDGGGEWWLDIKDQKCTVKDGLLENPRLILEMADSDFIAYFTGKVHPMELVRSKKMKFTGPMTEGIAFNAIWNIPVAPQG